MNTTSLPEAPLPDPKKRTRWFTGRKVITAVGYVTATYALFDGKMSDVVWVYAMAVFIAGHQSADLLKAWKGN